VAARRFVPGAAVFDLAHGVEANERGGLAITPQAQRLLGRADGPGFSAVLVHDDFRLFTGGPETVADEIHFGLHHRQIILRAALQHKTRTQRRKVGYAGDVQENILGQHRGQAGQNLLGLPALALEVHDVGLHENRAAIAEDRHSLRGECQISELVYAEAETFGGGLQEVSIAGRTLGIELEVLYAPVVQNYDFDVLASDIHNHVRVVVELQGGLGVRHGFYQRHVGLEHVLKNVFGVSGGRDSEHLQLGFLLFHLPAQVLEHLNRVLDRISVRELIRLA